MDRTVSPGKNRRRTPCLEASLAAARDWAAQKKFDFSLAELQAKTGFKRSTLNWIVRDLPRRELCGQVFYRVDALIAKGN